MRLTQINYPEGVINYIMKYCLAIILCFGFYKSSAQKAISNIDSVYYLADTTKTPFKDRMLDVGVESDFKYFTLKCPCLKYNAEPTFIYKIKDTGQQIDGNAFKMIKTRSLPTLISLAKQTSDLTTTVLHVYFFIERNEENSYIIHKVRLLTPKKPSMVIDYQNIPPDN